MKSVHEIIHCLSQPNTIIANFTHPPYLILGSGFYPFLALCLPVNLAKMISILGSAALAVFNNYARNFTAFLPCYKNPERTSPIPFYGGELSKYTGFQVSIQP
jgi:hypothetical protein